MPERTRSRPDRVYEPAGRPTKPSLGPRTANVICADTEAGVEEKLAWLKDKYLRFVPEHRAEAQVDEFRRLSGTPEQIIERLRVWEAVGMTYAIVYFPDPAFDLSGLQLFATEVIPALSQQ